MRRVGLNLLYLDPGETGGLETVAREVVPRLAEAAPEIEFVAFVNDEAAPRARELVGERVSVSHIGVSGRARARRVLAEQAALPRAAARREVDLLHSLGGTGPGLPGVMHVVTVPDVIYAIEPEAHTPLMRAGMRVLIPLAVHRAERVITLSENAADEISQVLGYPRERIDAIHIAGRARVPATPSEQVRARYGLGSAPLVLSASARRPHKNLPRLLRAFAGLELEPAPTLVLPGYASLQDDELVRLAAELGVSERVAFLGWVPDADLEGLYAAATCSVFPSLAEGFGLPVLEAMERGVAVACSDASSLPEVGGEAVLYFDPLDEGAIRDALAALLVDAKLRERLEAAGLERAAGFSWEATAAGTIDAYWRAWAGVRKNS